MTAAPLWRPDPDRVRASQMHAFLERVAERHGVTRDHESLRRWSIERCDLFWAEMMEFAQVRLRHAPSATFSGSGMLGTRWFPEARLNYAEDLLRFSGSDPAILFESETGATATLSRDALRESVRCASAALIVDGVQVGDRVAAYMPNRPECVTLMLAAAARGAIWSSCSPDFGPQGVLDRFSQIEPAVLLVADGYSYGGKRIDTLDRAAAIVRRLPSLRRLVIVPYLGDAAAALRHPEIEALRRERGDALAISSWEEYLGAQRAAQPLSFEPLPFDHPLFIMYSSGTTGVPKCIVHGHGGSLLQHMKELMLHTDLREGDSILYFTTCGWMMWNWLVSGLGVGATVVLYEGSPTHPTVHRLWELLAARRVTVFGTSPKFLAACQKAHLRPVAEHDLSALRTILSTGSPLSDELFHYVYADVKHDVQLASISGGTDILSCFMLGNPLLPVWAGEIQCRGLGMDVQAWDGPRHAVTGRKGELVCCAPFPSQPVGFWNDPDGRRYRAAYFDHFGEPLVWRHGDFIEIRETGGVVVYGRSDATLNPGGIRIGTAEIYRIVEALPEIVDSVVTARRTPDQDEEVVLCVVLRAGLALDRALEQRIREAVAAGATRRHVPRYIRQVTAIPYTISGKKVELAVQQMLHGEDVANRDALANPEALEQYRRLV
ncbi:MAG: acetoacetate--CoA ligase [Planctomycetia bacterium]|nr:MAG: acetoacetate--CoA ligase [Planctomycetia bacterium]